MVKLLRNLPPQILRLIEDMSNLAYASGYKVYLVGGFVRDILLRRENLDLDIVVEGNGIDFAIKLKEALKGRLIKHKTFGTATLILEDGLRIDIATARREVYLKPAQLPKVSFGSIEDDLKRRDFSINALAVSLNRNDFGRVLDFFNGGNDIKKGYIRILHDKSFIDDPTRILRAIRFEQRFRFKLEPNTRRLIKEAKYFKVLGQVQKHRLRDEIILILKEEDPIRVVLRIEALYGLRFIHKDVSLERNTKELLRASKNVIIWFRDNFPRKRNLDTWLIYLIILLHNVKEKDVLKVCSEFAFRKGETKRIVSYKKNLLYLQRVLAKDALKPSKVYQILEPLSYEVILAVLASVKNKNISRHIYNFFNIYNSTRIWLSGDDLKNLNLKPGPHFKDILKKILYAKLDKKLLKKKEELDFLKYKLKLHT